MRYEISSLTSRLSRRDAIKQITEVMVATPAILGTVSTKRAVAACEPIDMSQNPLGEGKIDYCNNNQGILTITFRPDLAEIIMDSSPAEPNFKVRRTVIDDPKVNLFGFFQVVHKMETLPDEGNFAFRWQIGQLRSPFGMYYTAAFTESDLRDIHHVHLEWTNRQMYPIEAIKHDGNPFDFEAQRFYPPPRNVQQPQPTPKPEDPADVDPMFAKFNIRR